MLTDGIVDLYRAGVVTGARKTLHPGKVVCTFGVGTETQYKTADRNPDFLCLAVDLINLPHIVMQNDRVVAINNATQMDLQGQSASKSAGHRHISGTGGQSQFVLGAYASNGGKSFICMSSTYERRGCARVASSSTSRPATSLRLPAPTICTSSPSTGSSTSRASPSPNERGR